MRSIAIFATALLALSTAVIGAIPASAGIDIYIDKSSQRMTVAVNGAKRYNWPVSTAKLGYTTPSGTFTPFRLERDHFSQEWDDAPMPHSIFFTYQGHAIHGSYHTARLGRPASHGCVRLAPQNAAILFSLVTRAGLGNTRITVAGGGVTADLAPVAGKIKKAVPDVQRRIGRWLDRQRSRR